MVSSVGTIQQQDLLKVVDLVQSQLSQGGVEYDGEGALIQHIERQIESTGNETANIANEDREKIDMIDSLFQSIIRNSILRFLALFWSELFGAKGFDMPHPLYSTRLALIPFSTR